ncbi:hypothetical protein [Krasilnikoviella flava]|uniref:Uncharacterized protein n=1 Tax=Krasilnikoviella flava TaxID=526729 RepID=A0A1T5JQB5_9MICO|nr:hypothetical protein [Krasilnikoviella flava]SKC53523.1 hypothetical protein SAMN04324258_1618 [Krasilnikoviella flava]
MATKTTKTSDKFELHAAALTTAQTKVTAHADVLTTAQADVADLKARLTSGDESVTPDDYARGLAAADRAQLLLDGAEKAVKELEDRAPFRPWVAEALADVMAEELMVPVHVVEKAPAEAPSDVPAMFLVQPHAAERADKGWSTEPFGSYKGIVHGKFFRPGWAGTPINGQDIETRLNRHYSKAGQVSMSSVGTQDLVDSVTFSVNSIFPDLPSIPSGTLGDHTVSGFVDHIVTLVKGSPAYQAATTNDRGFATNVDVHALGVKIINHSVTANNAAKGVRRITIEAIFDVWVNEGMGDRVGDVGALVERVMASRVGGVTPHLGRVREAKVTRETMSVGDVLMQLKGGYYQRQDRGTVSVYKATFTIEAAA